MQSGIWIFKGGDVVEVHDGKVVCQTSQGEADEAIGMAIAKAVRHAMHISEKQHSSQAERLGHFLTALRREIGYLEYRFFEGEKHKLSNLISDLCCKSLWLDIGVVDQNRLPPGHRYVHPHGNYNNDIRRWIEISKFKAASIDPIHLIDEGFNELNAILLRMKHITDCVADINAKSDALLSDFAKTFSG